MSRPALQQPVAAALPPPSPLLVGTAANAPSACPTTAVQCCGTTHSSKMVQDGGRSPFAAALRSMADRPGPLPEEEARQFLQQWPLEAVFRCGPADFHCAAIVQARECLLSVFCILDNRKLSHVSTAAALQGAERATRGWSNH